MWILLTMMAYADGNCLTAQCDEPTPPPVDAASVLNRPLQSCSTSPMTGWYRDSYCRTDDRDRGVHVVCATMTDDFLTYTKAQGNDLSTPSPRSSFPGLKAGDNWCLCASRWLQAHQAGYAPTPVLAATHEKALGIIPKAVLFDASTSSK